MLPHDHETVSESLANWLFEHDCGAFLIDLGCRFGELSGTLGLWIKIVPGHA